MFFLKGLFCYYSFCYYYGVIIVFGIIFVFFVILFFFGGGVIGAFGLGGVSIGGRKNTKKGDLPTCGPNGPFDIRVFSWMSVISNFKKRFPGKWVPGETTLRGFALHGCLVENSQVFF